MTQDADIVEDIFARVKQILGDDFKGDIAIKLKNEEEKVRQSWGGGHQYVSNQRWKNRKKKEQAMKDLNKGVPVNQVIKSNGISRTEVYRLLKRK